MSDRRPEHIPSGPQCSCGVAASKHRPKRARKPRIDARDRRAYKRQYRAEGRVRDRLIVAIDGEGYTDKKTGRHLYTYVAACSAEATISELHRPLGVDATSFCEWILSLPRGALIVGFSLGYDLTKALESLPDRTLYRLTHPDMVSRQGKGGPKPVRAGEFLLNRISTRFSVKHSETGRSATVWDLFKFFGCSFVAALREWGIGTKAEVIAVETMKLNRANFGAIGPREQAYCRSECVLLARLAAALIEAHKQADLPLPSFYGPGSTASVMLKKLGAEAHNVPLSRVALSLAVRSAFFGGRFECSRVGPVRQRVYAWDIASAYPYAMARLPCLRPCHVRWRYLVAGPALDRALGKCATACVRYRLRADSCCVAWGPLPVRLPTGDIIYPVAGPGGWAWLPELQAARELHPGVETLGAWVATPRAICRCKPPYQAATSAYYCARLQWGKDGRGRVIKLGLNSCYGKSAQRVGSAKYRCLVRAGLITAMTRAMLLRALASAKDPWNVLEIATDSISSLEPLQMPAPVDLGTGRAARKLGKAPLGAWEAKVYPHGVFLIRPGMRFKLGRATDLKSVAARGVGIRTLHANRKRLVDGWARAPMRTATVQQPATFHGCKGSIACKGDPNGPGATYTRSALYGTWVQPTRRNVSYAAPPKRREVFVTGQAHRLLTWELPDDAIAVSRPYGSTRLSAVALESRETEVELGDQGDADEVGVVLAEE